MLTVIHKERKKEAKKERKDYGYYTLIIYKNGLDKPDHLNAGVTGNRNLALQALMLDEMAILPEKAEAMLDELLANSKEFLPQFKKRSSADE